MGGQECGRLFSQLSVVRSHIAELRGLAGVTAFLTSLSLLQSLKSFVLSRLVRRILHIRLEDGRSFDLKTDPDSPPHRHLSVLRLHVIRPLPSLNIPRL